MTPGAQKDIPRDDVSPRNTVVNSNNSLKSSHVFKVSLTKSRIHNKFSCFKRFFTFLFSIPNVKFLVLILDQDFWNRLKINTFGPKNLIHFFIENAFKDYFIDIVPAR